MLALITKIIPTLFLWSIFVVVIFQVPYPKSLIQAQVAQLLLFFIPLILALGMTLNFFFKNIYLSFSISLGLTSLLILKALDVLNLVTGALTITTVGLLISYFGKIKRSGLTKLPKIPKLTSLSRKKSS